MPKARLILLLVFLFSKTITLAQTPSLDSLKVIIAAGNHDLAHVNTLNLAAYEVIRIDVSKAKFYLQEAIALGKKLNAEKALSSSYNQISSLYHNSGQADSAWYYLQLLKDLANSTTSADKTGIQANYYGAAGLYYKKTGDIRNATAFLTRSLQLAETLGNKVSIAGQALNLGNVYMNDGNYKKALTYHLKALKYFEETKNDKGISFCYQSIGNSFIELEQLDQGLAYIQKSLALKQALKDRRGQGTAYLALGQIYSSRKSYKTALAHFNTALEIAREFNLVKEQGNITQKIARMYAAKGDSASAMRLLAEAKELVQQVKDSAASAAIEMDMVSLQKKPVSSGEEKKLEITLQTVEATGSMPNRAYSYKSMAQFYTTNKDFEKALFYTKKYYEVNDSMLSNELQLQLKKMDEQYTVEKKEQEIALLKKDQLLNQQQLSQQRYLLISAFVVAVLAIGAIWQLRIRHRLQQRMKELKLRNQIAADLHDEVGSSLSSIHLLSKMAALQTQPAAILQKVSDNAEETMEKMSDIVWMIKPGEQEGKILVQRIERYLYEICNARNIECVLQAIQLDTLKLDMHQRKNLYLIFKEAVNNAVKYSNTTRLEVIIQMEQQGLVMRIRDFGAGFNETSVISGNGLQNMRMRAKELKGKLHIESQIKEGTELRLQFPV
jgi:two-component system, NarL family, sensor histidine kinase UhpB